MLRDLPVNARRAFRLSLTVSLSLVIAYALRLPLPFIAPLFGILLSLKPTPPISMKNLLKLILVVAITLSSGVILTPLLTHYSGLGLVVVAVGIYFSIFMTHARENAALIGTLLTLGITLISAAGTLSSALSMAVIQAIVLGIAIATFCQWMIYPLFPEPDGEDTALPPTEETDINANWIALRTTIIVFPVYLLVLVNPTAYMPLMMKSTVLAQQASFEHARSAGKELIGATLLAGLLAVLLWFGLKMAVNLWMFFLWMTLFGLFIAAKFYHALPTRRGPMFWQDVFVTLIIFIGPAVQDSANGKDVYAAFITRLALFMGLTLYAWLAVYALEQLKARRHSRTASAITQVEFN
ncbi:MAG: DUF2955 domain-containing protein [Candidatus Thiodiazotropha sp.]